MSHSSIRAVLFDMGGTLEEVTFDDQLRLQAAHELREFLAGEDLDPGLATPDLCFLIERGMKKYKEWKEATEIELPPEKLWADFIFWNQRLPSARLAAVADELSFFYENHFYRRRLRVQAPAVLASLHGQGLKLGVISNSIGRLTMPRNLASYGIAHYFFPVISSACVGWRKPNVHIFEEASRALALPPAACAYVGDTISRDITGARRAGFGLAIQIKSFLTAQSDRESDIERPDAVVENLMQVLELVTAGKPE